MYIKYYSDTFYRKKIKYAFKNNTIHFSSSEIEFLNIEILLSFILGMSIVA